MVRGFIYKEKLNCDIAISFFDKGIKELSSKIKLVKMQLELVLQNTTKETVIYC